MNREILTFGGDGIEKRKYCYYKYPIGINKVKY